MSDTLAPVERARVLVPTKNDVLETRKEAIQTSIEPEWRPRFVGGALVIRRKLWERLPRMSQSVLGKGSKGN